MWADRAACRDHEDADTFFDDEFLMRQVALPICGGCPVKSECLEFALDRGMDDGVWGGMMPKDRALLRRRMRRRRAG